MPEAPVRFERPSPELRKGGTTVGITDRIYDVVGDEVTFDDVVVKGDLSGELEYNGHRLEVVSVETSIGLDVGPRGVRGPVWKGVRCRVRHD